MIEWIVRSLSCIGFKCLLSTYLLLPLAKLRSFPQEKYGAVLVLSLGHAIDTEAVELLKFKGHEGVRMSMFPHLENGMSRS